MGRIFLSLVLFFIVAGGVLVYQATQGTSSLVLKPSELVSRAHARDLPRIRVGGRVAEPIEYQTEPSFILRFRVSDPVSAAGGESGLVPPTGDSNSSSTASSVTVPVEYRNLKPDMFQAGRDVLIDGDFKDGTIIAAKLQTQCPSKYEPAMPGSDPGASAMEQ
ncbi:MAG: cytochrome c maturation protein CcmE [Pseudomonadota bacterium]|jgi:cytochrome c-type biogenesis protein CcmE